MTFTRLLLLCCLMPMNLYAADQAEAPADGWSGEGELGYTSTSGNTDSENLNASLALTRKLERWKHSVSLEAIRNEVDDETSADSKLLKLRSERGIGEKAYLFGQLRYEDDEFSGYDNQTSVTVGAGARFVESERHLLDASAGVGYRSLELADGGDSEEVAIVTAEARYEYRISESATFAQALLVESGDENTHTESETSLKSKIQGNLSARIAYLVKRNSDVPQGVDKSDEIVTVSLVYAF